MDFGIGYRWRSYESNLLLAVRLASDESGGADAAAVPSAEPAQPKPPRARGPRPPAPIGQSHHYFWFSR
jgi:hypothetical protein